MKVKARWVLLAKELISLLWFCDNLFVELSWDGKEKNSVQKDLFQGKHVWFVKSLGPGNEG